MKKLSCNYCCTKRKKKIQSNKLIYLNFLIPLDGVVVKSSLSSTTKYRTEFVLDMFRFSTFTKCIVKFMLL